jgi:hypothetical protein
MARNMVNSPRSVTSSCLLFGLIVSLFPDFISGRVWTEVCFLGGGKLEAGYESYWLRSMDMKRMGAHGGWLVVFL